MDDAQMTALLRDYEKLDWEAMSGTELAHVHEQLRNYHKKMDELVREVAWHRADRWWQTLPPDDVKTIRLLMKGAKLTPQVLHMAPELTLLSDLEDPEVVRLWAQMTPEKRAQQIDNLRAVLSLAELRRTTTTWEDEKQSKILAYEVLGLTHNATWSDVRKTYRELVATHHPDKGGDPRFFKLLQKAYKLLEERYL